jgi:hypothetical protein
METRMEADNLGKLFIERIICGEIKKDTLKNTSPDFSGEGERKSLTRYNAYLSTIAYKIKGKSIYKD